MGRRFRSWPLLGICSFNWLQTKELWTFLFDFSHVSKVRERAKAVVFKLKSELPRQQFNIAIQAGVGGKILARDDLKPLKKDVLAKCYGGDITRKMKLLRHQAEGKKRMKKFGNIEIAKDTFIKILTK